MPKITEGIPLITHVREEYPSEVHGASGTYATLGNVNSKKIWLLVDDDEFLSRIPQGANVTAATLNLYAQGWTTSGSNTIRPYAITGSWSPSSVSWNNKPSYTDVADPTVTQGSYNGYLTLNILKNIQRLAAQGSAGWKGILLAPTTTTNAATDYLTETGASMNYQWDYVPLFSVTFTIAPDTPTNLKTDGGSGTSTSPKLVPTLTPALTWSFVSKSDQTIKYAQVLIYDADSGALVHDTGQRAQTVASYTVPAGVLAWGKKYRWKVRHWDTDNLASGYSADSYLETNNLPTAALTGLSSSSSAPTIMQDSLTPTINWTYSDTEGDAQKAVNIQILEGSTVRYDSGQINTTATSYQIPSSAGLSYNKTYTVKIRAKDVKDLGWGAWSASRYFLSNRKPSVSSLTPAGGSAAPYVLHNTITPALGWTFSDPDGHAQAAYDLEIYDLQDVKVHSSGQVTSSLKTHDAAGLQYGKIYKWRVRAKDIHDNWSDWASYQYFYTNRDPLKPDLHQDGIQTDPFIIRDDLTPTFDWSFFDDAGESQAAYEFNLLNDLGTVIYTTGVQSGSIKTVTIPYANKLNYDTLYQIRVRTQDNYGQWSVWSDVTWIKSILGAPTGLIANADNYGAKIYLEWDDSLAEGLQGYNVYRSTDQQNWTKINTSLVTQSSFVDSSIVSDVVYYYAVEAYISDTQISAKSAAASASAVFSAWFIGDFKFEGASSFSKKRKRSRSVKQTLTRRIVQDSGSQKNDISMEILLLDDAESTGQTKYDQLMTELERTEILSLRDSFGNVWSVTVGDFDDEPLIGTGKAEYKVKIELTEV